MNASITLLITCSTVFLAQLGMSIYLPALPQIALYLRAEPAQVSWGLSLYLIGMALPMLLWGSLAQRIGRKPVLLAALVIYGLANLALPRGSTLEAFLLLRLMQGVGASGISVMARVLIRDSFRGDLLAKALSWVSISFVVALGIGQYAGSLIEATAGWQAIFYWLGATSLLMALMVSRVAFPPMADEPASASSWSAYRQILLHRAFLLPALAGGLGYGVIIAFNTAAPLILQGPFAWSSVDYGLLGWPISAAYFLGALDVAGQSGGKFHRVTVLVAVLRGGVRSIIELPDQPVARQRWRADCRGVCDGAERVHSSIDGGDHRRAGQSDRQPTRLAPVAAVHVAGRRRDVLYTDGADRRQALEGVAEDFLDLALIRRPRIGQTAGVLQGIAGE
jgi:MFS family permease